MLISIIVIAFSLIVGILIVSPTFWKLLWLVASGAVVVSYVAGVIAHIV